MFRELVQRKMEDAILVLLEHRVRYADGEARV